MSVAYITKDSTREEVYDAYIKAQKLLKMERHRIKKMQGKIAEVRKEKNERYSKLRYQVLKRDQKIYRLVGSVMSIKGKYKHSKRMGIKEGREIERNRIVESDLNIKSISNFLFELEMVSNIFELNFRYVAFVLWAGKYEFFNRDDFKRDFGENWRVWTSIMNYMRKTDFLTTIGEQKKNTIYALSGTGRSMYQKLSNFTKKHFNE